MVGSRVNRLSVLNRYRDGTTAHIDRFDVALLRRPQLLTKCSGTVRDRVAHSWHTAMIPTDRQEYCRFSASKSTGELNFESDDARWPGTKIIREGRVFSRGTARSNFVIPFIPLRTKSEEKAEAPSFIYRCVITSSVSLLRLLH